MSTTTVTSAAATAATAAAVASSSTRSAAAAAAAAAAITSSSSTRSQNSQTRRKRFSTFRWIVQYSKRGKALQEIVAKIKQDTAALAAAAAMDDDECDATPINILILDGGGMKGFAHTAMFEELLKKAGEDFLPYFDLAAGTSVGGVAVLVGSHIGGDANGALQVAETLLLRSQSEAFAKWSCTKLLCKGVLLRNDNRANIFQDQFGADKPLLNSDPSHLKAFAVCCLRQTGDPTAATVVQDGKKKKKEPTKYAPFLVRTYEPVPENNNNKMASSSDSEMKDDDIIEEENLFLPGTHEVKLWEALTATSSAPLMCDRIEIDVGGQTKRLADGGCVSNSPIAIAIHEAKALWPGRPIGIVLSVGLDEDHEVELNRSAVEHARETSPDLTFVRLRPPINDFTSFGTDPKKIKHMQDIAREYIRGSREAEEVLEKLMSSCPRRGAIRRQSNIRGHGFLSGFFHLGKLAERRQSKKIEQRQSLLHFFRGGSSEVLPPPTDLRRYETR